MASSLKAILEKIVTKAYYLGARHAIDSNDDHPGVKYDEAKATKDAESIGVNLSDVFYNENVYEWITELDIDITEAGG